MSDDISERQKVLKSLLQQIREHQELEALYRLAIYRPGRAAISREHSLWDFIPFISDSASSSFTAHLHYTISLAETYTEGMITIPNGIKGKVRKNISRLPRSSFFQTIANCAEKAENIFSLGKNAQPVIHILQRRYPSQRARPIIDSSLIFDIRTATGDSSVKKQPQWLDAAYEVLLNKNSNLQFQIGVRFNQHYTGLKNPQAYRQFIKILETYAGFVDLLMKD